MEHCALHRLMKYGSEELQAAVYRLTSLPAFLKLGASLLNWSTATIDAQPRDRTGSDSSTTVPTTSNGSSVLTVAPSGHLSTEETSSEIEQEGFGEAWYEDDR